MAHLMYIEETFVVPVSSVVPDAVVKVWESAVFHENFTPPAPVLNDSMKEIWDRVRPTPLKTKEDASLLKTKEGVSPRKTKEGVSPRKTKGDVNPLNKGSREKVALVCNLCKKSVKQYGNFKSGRFGILENCNHVFCLSCIRYNRVQSQKKNCPIRPDRKCDQYPVLPLACPVCNAKSSCIASSYMYISEAPLKNMYLEQFKMEMAHIPCQWMKIGLGVCAYSNDCSGHADLDRFCGGFPNAKKEIEPPALPRWPFQFPPTQF